MADWTAYYIYQRMQSTIVSSLDMQILQLHGHRKQLVKTSAQYTQDGREFQTLQKNQRQDVPHPQTRGPEPPSHGPAHDHLHRQVGIIGGGRGQKFGQDHE